MLWCVCVNHLLRVSVQIRPVVPSLSIFLSLSLSVSLSLSLSLSFSLLPSLSHSFCFSFSLSLSPSLFLSFSLSLSLSLSCVRESHTSSTPPVCADQACRRILHPATAACFRTSIRIGIDEKNRVMVRCL